MAKKRSRTRSRSKKRSTTKKKARTTKRKLTSSKKVATTSASEVNRHIHVVANPFSNATQHPKMPDGKVPMSLSRRLRNTVAFTASTSTYTDILVAPLFGNMANLFSSSITTDKGVGIIGAVGQTVGFECNIDGAGPYTLRNAANGVAKQRIISQAIRLTQINNDEENDGWYEACRINLNKRANNYLVCGIDNTDTALRSQACVLATDNTVQVSYLNGLPLVEQPGYSSGMLKDLKNKEFRLQPVGCECHMNECPSIKLALSDGTTGDIIKATNDKWAYLEATVPATNALELGLDDSWDCVLIRIHGRSGGEGTTPSSFIAECIQNVEFCFSPQSDLATFMTPNVRHKQVEQVLDKMNNKQKAEDPKTG